MTVDPDLLSLHSAHDKLAAASFDALVHERRSVRGFRPEPVPRALIEHVFTVAQQAPSNCNTQPWIVHVVSGEATARMRTLLHGAAQSRTPASPDVPLTGKYLGDYRDRQIDSAKALFAATGVGRDDPAARVESMLRNFRFFDAPHAAFLFLPNVFGLREAADCGMFAQTLMLALSAHGLGSCAQGALSHYAGLIHEELGVPDHQQLLFGIAFGYEDSAHPANATRVARAPIASTTTFHD